MRAVTLSPTFSTCAALVEDARAAAIASPAVLIVGDVLTGVDAAVHAVNAARQNLAA